MISFKQFLNEISKNLAQRYINKSSQSHQHLNNVRKNAVSTGKDSKPIEKKMKQRNQGMTRAFKKIDEGVLSSLKKSFTANSRRAALKSKIDSKMDDQQKKVIGRKVNGDASKAENDALGNDKRYSSLNKRRMKISENIKGWKNAHSDIMKHRSNSSSVYTHRLKKDGSLSGMHDAKKSHPSLEYARKHVENIKQLNPSLQNKHSHAIFVDNKEVERH